MKEYLNIKYRGVYPVHILICTISGGISTIAGIPFVAEPYGLDKFAIGLAVGLVIGLLAEVVSNK